MLGTNGIHTVDGNTHTHLAPAVSLVVANSLHIFSLFDGEVKHTLQVAFDQRADQYPNKN